MVDALKIATLFHETYERLAPSFGYETRTDTRVFDHESKNGKLMLAVCQEVGDKIETEAFKAGFTRGMAEGQHNEQRLLREPVQPVYRAFGARVEYIRQTLGMTQHDLAKLVNMTRGSIANIETGRQRVLLHDIERFTTAFNTTPKGMMKGIWY